MTTFNRDRFKAARLDVNKKVADEAQKATATNDSKRGDYHKIDDGPNYFRMMPPHDENEPSMQPKVVYWLDCRIEETDTEGKPTGKTVVKPRPIFDSKVHGGTPKDVIAEYISFTKNSIINSVTDKEERKKMFAPIQGWRDKAGKWNPGILPNHSYVCYATKGDIIPENLGRLEMWENDKKTLERLNVTEKAEEPIITDSFSDPNTGSQFIFTKGRDNNNKPFNAITKRTFEPPRGMKANEYGKLYEEFMNSQVVPDEVLIRLSEMEPLSVQFKNAYKKADFDRALDALQMFDSKHGFGTFDNDEFLTIVEEISGYYVESETHQETKSEEIKSKIIADKPSIEDVDLYDMTRSELKEYIKVHALPIKVVASMSDDVIRELILSAENPEETEDSMEEKEEEDKPDIKTKTQKEDKSETSNLEKDFESRTGETTQTSSQPVMSLKERLALLNKNKKN